MKPAAAQFACCLQPLLILVFAQHLTSCSSLGEASRTLSFLQAPAEDPQTIDLVAQPGMGAVVHLPSLPQVLVVHDFPSSHEASSVHLGTGVELQFISLSKLQPVPNDIFKEDAN